MIRQLLREPLLHFLIIGVAVFLVYDQVAPPADDGGVIMVSAGEQQAMRARFHNTWQRPPTAAEMQQLIDDYVLDEVYVREALAIGLDADDRGIRQRLRRKMAFLLNEASLDVDPDDTQLQTFYDKHPDQFRRPARYSFEQILIPASASEAEMQVMRDGLVKGKAVDGAASLLAPQYHDQEAAKLESLFGRDFTGKLEAQPVGQWQGPLASAQGRHFIKVTQVQPGELPELPAIRERVAQAWVEAEKNQRMMQLNEKLLARYSVEVERADG